MTYERRVAQDRSLTDRHMPMSAALALVCVCVCASKCDRWLATIALCW